MAWKEFLSWALKQGFVLTNEKDIPYGRQVRVEYRGDKVPLSWYTSGKVSIQGKPSALKAQIETYWGKPTKESAKSVVNDKASYLSYIGSDESGKGDYFGPLVVANAYIPEGSEQDLIAVGVKDSKKLSPAKIIELAASIKEICEYESIVLMPEDYNFIYEQEQNLNKIMVNLHTEVNRSLSGRVPAKGILIDQFTSQEHLLKDSLSDTGMAVVQRFRAEEFLPVACASIIARSLFVEAMDLLSDRWDMHLAKGASIEVENIASRFYERYGKDKMKEVAKLHFATSKKIGLME